MKCLLDRISTCEAIDVIWLAQPVGAITAAGLLSVLAGVDSTAWHRRRVGIGALPVIEFVSVLAFLDGLAEAIVLLPAEDDIATRTIRLTEAGVDVVLEGAGIGFSRQLETHCAGGENGAAHPPVFERPPALETTWLLPTSGTTGIPKLIAHTFGSLTRSMSPRRIGNDYLWGSLYSLRRFAGLQVLFQSSMNGTPLVLNEEGADLYDVLSAFIDSGCNALSATPSMWRKMAMHPLFDQLALKQATLGGEIVDQAVLDLLARRFPAARITHIYASTEAGVGFAVRDGRAGFPLDYLLHPPSGVAMRIDEQNHLWFGSLPAQSSVASDGNNWIDSGDVVEVGADRVRFLGRANGSINVGGNKVMPEEIESVIKELPEVALVQVRARKSALLGSLVEAAITPVPGILIDAAFRNKVFTHCRQRLNSFKVPAFVVASDAIQLTASGKLSRSTAE